MEDLVLNVYEPPQEIVLDVAPASLTDIGESDLQ